MPQLGFKIDLSRCVGCKACEVACKQEQNTIWGVRLRRVVRKDAGTYPTPKALFVSLSCNHCAEPACLKSCPVGAIKKDPTWGLVLIDQQKCNGCRYCEAVCPYGAPQFNPVAEKVEKCTLCVHRVLNDDRTALTGYQPACVATCIGKALELVTDFDGATESDPGGFGDRAMTTPSIAFTWGKDAPW